MALRNLDVVGEPYDFTDHNGKRLAVYVESPDLPNKPKKILRCIEHMQEGVFTNATSEFMNYQCTFPAEDDPSIIRFQHVCPGPGLIRECRLRIEQYDARGNKI